MNTSADTSKTPPALEPREITPLEIDLMVASDVGTQPTMSKHYSYTSDARYHGSHAGSGTGATADVFPVPSLV